MKQHEETLIKQKDFIFAVAKDLINPNESNTNVQEILAAYHEIDKTVKVSAECQSCQNTYKNSFNTILDYCNDKNWFQVEAYNPVVTGTTVTGDDVLKSMGEAYKALDSFTKSKPKK